MFPRLRALQISRFRDDSGPGFFFHDPEGLAPDCILSAELEPILARLDGTRSLQQIWSECGGDDEFPLAWLEEFLEKLDGNGLLESPRLERLRAKNAEQFSAQSVREAALAGRSYPAQPEKLRAFLEQKQREGRERLPQRAYDPAQIRGIVTPHIDFGRGGHTEAASYDPLLENVRATGRPFDTLVILGIAHAGVHFPFCGADKDFQTPFGTQGCDRELVGELSSRLGPRFLQEQSAHKNEHSIEFASVFCQMFDELRSAQLVPILCGGFWESLRQRRAPEEAEPEVRDFIRALRETVQNHERTGKKIGFIASVDGAHVGTQFGDRTPLTPPKLRAIRWSDRAWCAAIEAGDKVAFHEHFARDGNKFNVDAHPAVYTLLAAFPDWRGQLLDYDQAYNEEQNIVVSFASLALFEV